jgi:putative transposase
MPKISRVVIPHCPHHITQRGNRRQKVFFSEGDKKLYLKLLKVNCLKQGIKIWAYCLMDNHVHFIGVPQRPDSLAKGIGETHRKYTTVINIRHNWKGFLWQGRFESYPMDEKYLYSAVRYVEQNPVKARIVKKAEEYLWSSARAHVLKHKDDLLEDFYLLHDIEDWAAYLSVRVSEEDYRLFQQHERTGRPLGSEEFIRKLEQITGRVLIEQKAGRPKKESGK